MNSFHFTFPMQHRGLTSTEISDKVNPWSFLYLEYQGKNRDRYWVNLGPVIQESRGVGEVGDTLSTHKTLPMQRMLSSPGKAHILYLTLFQGSWFCSFLSSWSDFFGLHISYGSILSPFVVLLAVPLWVLLCCFLVVVLQFINMYLLTYHNQSSKDIILSRLCFKSLAGIYFHFSIHSLGYYCHM